MKKNGNKKRGDRFVYGSQQLPALVYIFKSEEEACQRFFCPPDQYARLWHLQACTL